MRTRNWLGLDVPPDATGRPSGPIVFLLDGREFASMPPNTMTTPTPIGVMRRSGDHLVAHPYSGAPFHLDAKAARGLLFDVPAGEHQAVASGVLPRDAKLAIIAKTPAWAQRTVAEHLLQADVAAHDRAERDARVAQLTAIGKAARGGAIPAQNSVSAGQSDRATRLREIGRLASRG